jgi:hypothetical protein
MPATDSDPDPDAVGVGVGGAALVDAIAARLLDLLVDMESVPQLLQGICELAVEAVPDCESAGLTVIAPGVPVIAAASDERARMINAAQYRDGDGPSLRAAQRDADTLVHLDLVDVTGESPLSADSFGEASGPPGAVAPRNWQETAAAAGITTIVALPIPATADLRAALTLYTGQRQGWRPEALSVADALVTYAGDAITIGFRIAAPSPRRCP